MTFTRPALVLVSILVAVAGVALVWPGLALSVLTLIAMGTSGWLVVIAWGAGQVPGTTPAPMPLPRPTNPPTDRDRLDRVVSDARVLPAAVLRDPAAQDLLGHGRRRPLREGDVIDEVAILTRALRP